MKARVFVHVARNHYFRNVLQRAAPAEAECADAPAWTPEDYITALLEHTGSMAEKERSLKRQLVEEEFRRWEDDQYDTMPDPEYMSFQDEEVE